jgi:4-oxalocrotonate tautomerase
MPFVKIVMAKGKPAAYRKTVGDVIHQAMVDTINCPPKDRFQAVVEVSRENFMYAPEYLDIPHGEDFIFIQITLNEGRSLDLKKALYKTVAEGLNKAVGVPLNDVMINLVEVKKENWSFGNGIAQYA